MAHSSRITFSSAAAKAAMAVADEDEELDEEPGEVIESAPPLRVGEEREIPGTGLKKKLIRAGRGWETPVFGDEVTVHYVGTLMDGSKFDSSRDRGEPLTFKLGSGELASGLDDGLVTMKKDELAMFTLQSPSAHEIVGARGIPPCSSLQFEVELTSWFKVVDICKDGGIVKKIMSHGDDMQIGDLDEVTVKYQVKLPDGSVVAESPERGCDFYVNEEHLCPALSKVLKTMRRGEKALVTVQPQYAFGEPGRIAENGFHVIPSNATVHMEIELLSLRPVLDVSVDMKVLKKILKSGEGIRTPNECETVRIRYTAMLEDGTIFEKKGFDGESFEFVLDEEQVITGLDQAVGTMLKGELSLITVKPECGYGNDEVKCELAVVPRNSILIYEVDMIDFIKEKEPWQMTGLEKIEAAEKTKKKGNDLYKSGKFMRAVKRYDKAVNYVSEDASFEGDDEKLVKMLRISCWLNHAACRLKLNEFSEAIKLCSKVLDLDYFNVKALYRRAQAYIQTNDLDLAKWDIQKALEADPQNREVKSLQTTLKQFQTENNKRDAKLFGNIFERMRKDTDVALKRLRVEKPNMKEKDGTAVQAMEFQDSLDNEIETGNEKNTGGSGVQAMEM